MQMYKILNLELCLFCSQCVSSPPALVPSLACGEGKVQEELPSSSCTVRIYALKSGEMQLLFCCCLKPELLSLAK